VSGRSRRRRPHAVGLLLSENQEELRRTFEDWDALDEHGRLLSESVRTSDVCLIPGPRFRDSTRFTSADPEDACSDGIVCTYAFPASSMSPPTGISSDEYVLVLLTDSQGQCYGVIRSWRNSTAHTSVALQANILHF
jgi:hypothetical protein